jgi:hypothetical protein
MALVNPNIAMSFRAPEMPQQNALADYAAIQQIQGSQRQGEVAQMQLESMRRDQAALSRMQAAITAKGGPADLNVAADEMIKSGIPEYLKQGLVIKQTLDKQSRFASLLGPTGGAAPAAAPASEAYPGYNEAIGMRAPTNALAPASEAYPGYNESIGMTNALAPAPAAAPVNPMADLRRKINEAYMIGTPEALAFAKAGEDQLKPTTDVSSMQALGFPSTPEGYAKFRAAQLAPPPPSDIAKLIRERDALPLNSPNRALYDKEIANRSAVAENARQRLAFDQNKFNWEKANPGFEIREADDGSVVGVNKRTLQAFPVTLGGAAPAVAPAAGGAGMPGARVSAPQAPLAGATPTAGKPLMGKPKEAPVKFNDTDLQLSGLAGSLKDFRKEVSRDVFTSAKFLPTGQDTAKMQAKYTALLMGVKDLYTLGALTGPDMGIIESQLTNPASWSGKFTTKEGFEAQIKVIEDMLKRSATNLENTYSRVPKATKKALADLDSGAGGAAGVDTSNPLLNR